MSVVWLQLRNQAVKNTLQGFRQAVHKLADNLDNLSQSRFAHPGYVDVALRNDVCRQVSYEEIADQQMLQIESLTKLIGTEASNQRESESSMTKLLEGMHQKLHREVRTPVYLPISPCTSLTSPYSSLISQAPEATQQSEDS